MTREAQRSFFEYLESIRGERIGFFYVRIELSDKDWAPQNGEVIVKKGDRIMMLEIYPGALQENVSSFKQIRESFSLLASKIRDLSEKPEVIAAITYHDLANIATRYGFTSIRVKNSGIVNKLAIKIAFKKTGRIGKNKGVGGHYFIYQKTADFLKQYEHQHQSDQNHADSLD